MTRPTPAGRLFRALLAGGWLVVAVACGGDDDTATAADTTEGQTAALEARLGEVLLTEGDLPGWVVEARPAEASPTPDDEGTCPGLDSIAVPQARVAVEFIQQGDPRELRFVFQDASAYADETEAAAAAAAVAEAFANCLDGQERRPSEFAVADVVPLDLASASLGSEAWGWHLAFGPPLVDDPTITGMDLVLLQHGPITSTVSLFTPVPGDLDVVALAALVDERLAAQ